MHQLRFLEAAKRELAELDASVAKRLLARLQSLAENVETIKHQALKGDLAGLYKLRVGDYRILYQVLSKENSVIVHSLGHRRDIYRGK